MLESSFFPPFGCRDRIVLIMSKSFKEEHPLGENDAMFVRYVSSFTAAFASLGIPTYVSLSAETVNSAFTFTFTRFRFARYCILNRVLARCSNSLSLKCCVHDVNVVCMSVGLNWEYRIRDLHVESRKRISEFCLYRRWNAHIELRFVYIDVEMLTLNCVHWNPSTFLTSQRRESRRRNASVQSILTGSPLFARRPIVQTYQTSTRKNTSCRRIWLWDKFTMLSGNASNLPQRRPYSCSVQTPFLPTVSAG